MIPASAFTAAAAKIGCEPAAIRAVFAVEASGQFLDANGLPPRRFEPHHFPERYWPEIGFHPHDAAPWRAAFALSATVRERMFTDAASISLEDACRATSWGAPQIMGFNHALAGFASAQSMAEAFRDPAAQIRGFVAFCLNTGLGGALRRKDWRAFALGYNGPGQAGHYAEKIAAAYARESAREPQSAPVAAETPPPVSDSPKTFWGLLAALWRRLARYLRYADSRHDHLRRGDR